MLFEAFNFFELLDDIAQHRAGLIDVVIYFFVSRRLPVLSAGPAGLRGSRAGHAGHHGQEQRTGRAQGRRRQPVPRRAAAGGCRPVPGRRPGDARRCLSALCQSAPGRPAQSRSRAAPLRPIYQPQRSWILGDDSRVYNYQLFDPDRSLFGGLNIFELDPATFALRRRIYAERARWDCAASGSGSLDPAGSAISPAPAYSLRPLPRTGLPRTARTAQLLQPRGPPGIPDELAGVAALHQRPGQAGFDVARLSVELHRKLAFPLIAPIVMLLAIPFSLLGGKPRGGRWPGSGRGHRRCLLGRRRAARSPGRRRPIAARDGRLGARRDFPFLGSVLLPEDADVKSRDQ